MNKKKKVYFAILSVVIILTLSFIWGNSIENREESSLISEGFYGGVVDLSEKIFGKSFSSNIFSVITHGVFRKLAHAFEYFVLGIEFSLLFIRLNNKSVKFSFVLLLIGTAVSSIDETIQIFSGRGPSFFDVLIDLSGYVVALILFYGLPLLISKRKRKKN